MRNSIKRINEQVVVANIDNVEYAFSVVKDYGGELICCRTERLDKEDLFFNVLKEGLHPIDVDALKYVVRRTALRNKWEVLPVIEEVEDHDCYGQLCNPYKSIYIGWKVYNNQKDVYYIQEILGGWKQNAIFKGTWEECQEYWQNNPTLDYGNYSIVHSSEYEVDYL